MRRRNAPKRWIARAFVALAAACCLTAQAQIVFRAQNSAVGAFDPPVFGAATSATLPVPAFRAAASAATTGGTLTIARPAGTVENDVMVLAIAVRPTTATIAAAGWTLVRRLDNANPNANSLAVYRKVAGAAEPANYSFTIVGSTHSTGGIQSYFNVDANNPLDVENGQNTANGTAHATPAITTTVPNAMVVSTHSLASATTWTPPAGMTESFDIATGPANAVGQTTEGNRVLQAARGTTGTKTANAAANADVGNAHILALRPPLRINLPAGAAVGDILIASVGVTPSSATVTAPAGWTLVREIDNNTATTNSLFVFRKFVTAAEPAFYDWTVSGVDFAVGGIQSFAGVDQTNPINVENGQNTASGTNHDTPSVTTTVANAMLVTSHTYASSRTWTPATAGLTEAFDRPSGPDNATGQSISGNYQLDATAGATGTKRSTAAGNADLGNTHILALRPSGMSITLNTPAGTVANDVLIVSIGFTNSAATVTTVPAGWTLLDRIDNTAVTSNSLAVYIRVAGAGEPASYTWTVTGATFLVGGIQGYSGVDTATPVDVKAGQCTPQAACTTAVTAHTTPSVTTTVANTMLVTSHTYASSRTWTGTTAGLIETFDRPSGANSATGQSIASYRQLPAAIGATGTKTATAAGNGDVGNTHILALRPLVASTPGSFNAFETSTPANAIAGQIYTKLVGTPFSLDVVAVLSGAQFAGFTNTVLVDLVTGSTGGLNCPGTPVAIAGTSQNVNLTNAGTTGAPVAKAGDGFTLTVVGGAGYDGTPSINNSLLAAHAGAVQTGVVGGTFGAGNPVSGTATAATFTYSEVGNFTIAANGVFDNSFTTVDQAAGDCTNDFSNSLVGGRYGCNFGNASASAAIGRFTPDHFDVALNVPVFTPACGGFTYVGQGFNYSTAPVITVTAKNSAGLGNATTRNYTGAWQKITNTSLTYPAGTNLGYRSLSGTLVAAGIPTPDPVIAAGGAGNEGTVSLTFGSGTGLSFQRALQVAPFDAEISLALNVTDSDTPAIAYAGNPAKFANEIAGGGIIFSDLNAATTNDKSVRFGRLQLGNANGSQLVPLALPMETQYWNGTVFVTNVDDNCTAVAAGNVGLGNFTGLASGDTTPSVAGAFSGGRKTLLLSPPGGTKSGSVDVVVNLNAAAGALNSCVAFGAPAPTPTGAGLAHLRGRWCGASFDRDPVARARFGVTRGADEVIFIKENF